MSEESTTTISTGGGVMTLIDVLKAQEGQQQRLALTAAAARQR